MTENKQFVYYEHKGADYILENPNEDLDFIEMLGDCLDSEEIVNRLNELYNENEQLKRYIKNSYMGSVCDNCEHCKEIHTNDWFNGIIYDAECEKGHIDMDISDCEDFKLTSRVFRND